MVKPHSARRYAKCFDLRLPGILSPEPLQREKLKHSAIKPKERRFAHRGRVIPRPLQAADSVELRLTPWEPRTQTASVRPILQRSLHADRNLSFTSEIWPNRASKRIRGVLFNRQERSAKVRFLERPKVHLSNSNCTNDPRLTNES